MATSLPRVAVDWAVLRHIFVGVDPAGGSSRLVENYVGIVAIVANSRGPCVVGATSSMGRTAEVGHAAFLDFVRELRMRAPHAAIVLAVEPGTGLERQVFWNLLKTNFTNCVLVSSSARYDWGSVTPSLVAEDCVCEPYFALTEYENQCSARRVRGRDELLAAACVAKAAFETVAA